MKMAINPRGAWGRLRGMVHAKPMVTSDSGAEPQTTPDIMMTTLEQVYFDQLRDLYSAESQLISALPEMAGQATFPELRAAINGHLEETRKHSERLLVLFNKHGLTSDAVVCDAMKGLLKEARKHVSETEPGDVRDALLIASANRIEHYEIAGYGVAKAFARTLGFGDDADLLDETLQEEGAADHAITKIATGGLLVSGVNEAASHA
jgi:ferritin-like metal-binding protein YciE